ncbi:MAG: 4Fe-4S dicluster domain-containing protein [Imperialibacter sp.]|uniref:4Fe-4S dicluster domain-containing protein n=1 Tax=Imperialibacter sp. TaxID=2038411 RepID=UPI0032EBDFDC
MDDRMRDEKTTYWSDIKTSTQTLLEGLQLSIRHLKKSTGKWALGSVAKDNYFREGEGLVTLQYPKEKLPVPDNGRYKLHNEIDDCIVCDKCAKICPVNCIDIEPVRAVEEIGKTSDGTSKRIYAAKFDIDMAKCCFCGLCTTVCPTECLTMTSEYDFSTFSVKEHNFAFAEMTPLEILEKKKAFEEMQLAKQQGQPKEASTAETSGAAASAKPVFRPKMPAINPQMPKKDSDAGGSESPQASSESTKKPVFRPKMPVMKPSTPKSAEEEEKATPKADTSGEASSSTAKKPVMKPKMPVMKPVMKKPEPQEGEEQKKTEETKKPVFRPKPIMKPKKDD